MTDRVDTARPGASGSRTTEPDPPDAPTVERYAIVVVLEARSPEQAWEALRKTAGRLPGEGDPDCVYIGAPWHGNTAAAEDLSTDHLELGMFVPNGSGFVPMTAVLRSCE